MRDRSLARPGGPRPTCPHPGRRLRAWSLVTLLLAGVLAALALPAAAAAGDNELVVTEPGVREQVERPPGFVTLAFSEPVDPSLAKVLVQDASGANVTTGELVVEGTNVSSQLLDGLAPGTYTVSYRLARSDGSPQGGTFQFSYGPGTFTEAAEQTWSGSADEPEVLKNPDPNGASPAGSPAPTDDPSGPASTAGPGTTPGAPPTATTSATTAPTGSSTAGSTPPTATTPPPGTADQPRPPATAALVLGAVVLCGLLGAGLGVVLHRRRS